MQLLSNLISAIKVAYIGRKISVKIKRSKFIESVLSVLLSNNYVNGFRVEGIHVIIFLKYYNGVPVFNFIKSISSSRKKVIVKSKHLPKFRHSHFFLLSTKFGILSRDQAMSKRVGGIALLSIV